MRSWVDITALCREHLSKRHLDGARMCFLNCLTVRSITTVLYGEEKLDGFAIDGSFFMTTSKGAADACVRRVVDAVSEIQEMEYLEKIDVMNTRIAKELRQIAQEERDA